ncbi:MAG: hypothetical protein H7A44_09235 [Opitutaceae bacterium]|nr:hypothetical protein [Cephaloticoccus sp.]MCP5530610.1 hypothetical protein [Opitutaceae bacterium]
MKDNKINSAPGEFTDAVLFVIGGGFFLLLTVVIISSFLRGTYDIVPTILFAAMNAFISATAFRRLRSSIKARAKKEAQQRGPRDWMGNPINGDDL